jgi:hypothetical protein
MEVRIKVPHGTDISVLKNSYPDIYEDDIGTDGEDIYFIGSCSDEEEQWFTRDEAINFCGFTEGLIEEAETLLEGNGGWAQGMLSCKDFSVFAIDDVTKSQYERESEIWWASFENGKNIG